MTMADRITIDADLLARLAGWARKSSVRMLVQNDVAHRLQDDLTAIERLLRAPAGADAHEKAARAVVDSLIDTSVRTQRAAMHYRTPEIVAELEYRCEAMQSNRVAHREDMYCGRKEGLWWTICLIEKA